MSARALAFRPLDGDSSLPVPQHLQEIAPARQTFGRLVRREDPAEYVIESADPALAELVKRIFPHARPGSLRFPATSRTVEDLHWLMLRYPLEVTCPDEYERDHGRAVALAQRRTGLLDVPPAQTPPQFTGTLRPYQAEDVARMIAAERMLNANEMGLGKTVEALAAIATAAAFPALLVVQPHVQLQWLGFVGAFLHLDVPGLLPLGSPDPRQMCHQIRGLKPYELPRVPLYLIHYGLLSAWNMTLRELGIKAVVFDEAQELRRQESNKYIAAMTVAETASYVWGLSGTPIYNKGGEIWAVLNAIELKVLGDEYLFKDNWCGGRYSDVVRDPGMLGSYLRREGLMIRRTKSEVGSQLPPKSRVMVPIEQDDTVYHRLVGEAVQMAREYGGLMWSARGEAARKIDQQTRQAAGIAKAPFAADYVRSLVEAGERPVVFAHHHAVHEIIVGRLHDIGVARMTGHETAAEKEAAKQRFLDGQDPVCLLALRASTGIDGLQRVGTCCVFAEQDWSPAIHRQAEDRLHRDGLVKDGPLLAYYLVAENSFDRVVLDVLGLKVAQAQGLLGDQPETEADRALSEQVAAEHITQLIEELKRGGDNGRRPKREAREVANGA